MLELSKKIASVSDVAQLVEPVRDAGKTVVTCNGTFDIFHAGHLFFLTEAKKQGDLLIVGLNSDASVRRNKGPERPLTDERHRAVVLAGLECVDHVVIFDEADPRTFISTIRPHVHCNGAEYGAHCIEAEEVTKHGGHVQLIEVYGHFRTSHLIDRIRQLNHST